MNDDTQAPDSEEIEGSYWDGGDAFWCWVGAGIFAALFLFGLGECNKATSEGAAIFEKAKHAKVEGSVQP